MIHPKLPDNNNVVVDAVIISVIFVVAAGVDVVVVSCLVETKMMLFLPLAFGSICIAMAVLRVYYKVGHL